LTSMSLSLPIGLAHQSGNTAFMPQSKRDLARMQVTATEGHNEFMGRNAKLAVMSAIVAIALLP